MFTYAQKLCRWRIEGLFLVTAILSFLSLYPPEDSVKRETMTAFLFKDNVLGSSTNVSVLFSPVRTMLKRM